MESGQIQLMVRLFCFIKRYFSEKRHEGDTMIIIENGYELEFLDNMDAFLGIPDITNQGQTFKKSGKLDKKAMSQLAEIQQKVKGLIRKAEQLLA
jgi:hypothetical protein